ncbi:hypothetical protein KJ980_05850 [Patescibacteria group bacterium]|nr:hypothetical protein [Patescibacteria group bacterium]MBU4016141.1 hypothetical protein [Patescibacteria group bacterium]MBU4099143.1 hypothetical protein [Patescibacteria group bacterium]
MTQTITVETKTVEKILSHLDELRQDMNELKNKLLKEEAPYGSDEWWEKEEEKATEDIKKRRIVTFNSVEEMQKHLNSLK